MNMPYIFLLPNNSQNNYMQSTPIFMVVNNTCFYDQNLITSFSSTFTDWPQNINTHPLTLPNLPSSPSHLSQSLVETSANSSKKVKNSRKRNTQKELQSAKKNSQSNIVNQLYSFFNSYEKSQRIVERAIRMLKGPARDQQKIKSIFYNIVRLINYKRGRKYVNKNSIRHYYTPQDFEAQLPDIHSKLKDIAAIDLEELCFLFRICTFHFLKTASINAILTSKRITMVAKIEHLKRRSKILQTIQDQRS